MPSPLAIVKKNIAYAYIAMSAVWLAFAAYIGSDLLLWPVGALAAGGSLIKYMPGTRLTWAWAASAAAMGLVLAVFQAYVAAPLVLGSFSTVAGASLVVFAVLAIAHGVLGYYGASGRNPK